MRRLPGRTRILGRFWTVLRPAEIRHPKTGEALDGLAVIDRRVILVRRGLRIEDARETLWHEIKHILEETTMLNPKTEAGHRVLSMLEDAVLADNPTLARLWTPE
jgi:hypothetical protein